MAMARSCRRTANILSRIANACTFHHAFSNSSLSSCVQRSSSHLCVPSAALSPMLRPFSSAPSWRSAMTTTRSTSLVVLSSAIAPAQPCLPWIAVRSYSKRPKKWQGGPHAFIQVEPGAPCPPYSPNAGSVKKRKHNNRMAQRHAFAKAQAQRRKQETSAALFKRDVARRKRWREGACRARAGAKHLEQQQATPVSA